MHERRVRFIQEQMRMNLKEDYVDGMAEELLTDMAERFFGKRKEIEDAIQTLRGYVDALNKKKAQVDLKARFLNLLLLTPENARAFFERIGGDPDTYVLPPEAADKALPPFISPALTAKGEYLKLVFWAYEKLQESVVEYIYGIQETDARKELPQNIEAHYTLIDKMCFLINEEIEKINQEMSPGQVLDCFRRFDPAGEEKRHVTGGGSDYSDECTLNRRMAYKPLNCSDFELIELPELPPLKTVKPAISDFCKKLFSEETHQTLRVVDTVRHRLKRLQKERESASEPKA